MLEDNIQLLFTSCDLDQFWERDDGLKMRIVAIILVCFLIVVIASGR